MKFLLIFKNKNRGKTILNCVEKTKRGLTPNPIIESNYNE